MKRPVKISLISVGSVLGVLAVALVVALYLVFTPARLTSIVNKISKNYLNCESHFEKVELTLFSTFPFAGLEVHDFSVVNPSDFASSDTLAHVGTLTVAINVSDFIKNGDIIVRELRLDGVDARLAVAADGRTNFDVLNLSETQESEESESSMPKMDLSNISVSRLNCSYDDYQSGINVALKDARIGVDGKLSDERAKASLSMSSEQIAFMAADSLGKEMFAAVLDRMSAKVSADGSLDNTLAGSLRLDVPSGVIRVDGQNYVCDKLSQSSSDLIHIKAPFEYSAERLALKDALLAIAQFQLGMDADVEMPSDGGLRMQIRYALEDWDVADLVSILPYDYASWSEGMILDAEASATGKVDYSADSAYQSCITADLHLSRGRWGYPESLPYVFDIPQADADLYISLTDAPSSLNISSIEAKTGKNRLYGSVMIDDLTDRFLLDAKLNGLLQLHDVMNLVYYPEPIPMKLEGATTLKNVRLISDLDQLVNVDLAHMKVNGSLSIADLDVDYDSIMLDSKRIDASVAIPSNLKCSDFASLIAVNNLKGSLHVDIPALGLDAVLHESEISIALSDVMSNTQPFSLMADFGAEQLDALFDSIPAKVSSPNGSFVYAPYAEDPARERYRVNLNTRSVEAQIDDSTSVYFAGLKVKGGADYDSTRSNVLKQWSPDLDIEVMNGRVESAQLIYSLLMPDFKMNYKPEVCEISSANLTFGNSDYDLHGQVYGLENWLSSEGMLTGDLYFNSNYTNVDDLLEVFSGMGSSQDTIAQMRAEDNVPHEANPFLVPKDVDFCLHTNIRNSLVYGNEFEDLKGNIYVKDGEAVLDQVGFTCKAAKMQVTGVYRSPRPNNLYAAFDFHLLDIQIDELINMIPQVDTLVPMLKSFAGNADFHLAGWTNLDAYYNVKPSSVRAASAIIGKDLVVLDDATFDKIAKLMLFKRKTENKIDSLEVEMALRGDFGRLEVSPSLLSLDKYQVCVSGIQILDSVSDYHLEILKSPLPSRIAVDVKGLSPFKIALGKVMYPDLYAPAKHTKAEAKAMEVRQIVRKSLERNVRQSTRDMKNEED